MRGIKASSDLQGIPLVFFAADEYADEHSELIDLGACHVFKKPFFPKTFADELIKVYNER